MSVGDFNDVLFSQDERAEIGYGSHSDFVSKLIEKARSGNQSAVKTPPPPTKIPGSRLGALKKPRRDSKEVESALRALKNPIRKVDSPGPVTRSQTAESGTPSRSTSSKPSLDDSTEAIFGALPPTPNLERTQKNLTPRNHRVVPFRRSEINSSSTPDSSSKQSTRPKYRTLNRAASSSSFGLDRSTGSTGYRGAGKKNDTREDEDDDDEDSLDDDILIEATQKAELQALSQRIPKSATPKSNLLKDASSDTPKTAGRVRPTSTLKTLNSSTERKSIDFKDKLRSSQTPRKSAIDSRIPVAKPIGPSGAKCTTEEIQKKKEAALLRRKLRMSVK